MSTPQLLEPPAGGAPASEPYRRSYAFRAAADGDHMRIKGHATVWGSRNSHGEVFVPGAWKGSLERKSALKPAPMGLYHREVIGKWEIPPSCEDATGLYLDGPISKTQRGEEASTLVADGAITGLSVGFWPLEEVMAEPGERVTFETHLGTFTYQFERWTWYVLEAELVEASLVMAPSDDEARLVRGLLEQAPRALPALRSDASWEDTAYSMALLMGGRGAGAFSDAHETEHRALYQRVARAYERHGRTPPAYERAPDFKNVEFRHDEKDVFQDRYLRKTLDSVTAGARGVSGPLSADTRTAAQEAVDALTPLLQEPADGATSPEPEQLSQLQRDLEAITRSITTQE